MEWFLKVVRDNYANFNGGARRKEYSMFTLFKFIFGIIAAVVDGILGMQLIGILLFLALLIPGLEVALTGLHNNGRSGWWILLSLIPLAGIAILVFPCLDRQPGENKWGVTLRK